MVKSELKIQVQQSKQMASSSSTPASTCKKMKKFKGVRMRSWGSWVSEIRAPNQKTRIWLGSYSTAEAAARAYDAALLCLKGSSANLNFPITTSSHYIPTDPIMSPKSIQRVAAAAAAANSFVDNATAAAAAAAAADTTTPPPISPPPPSTTSSSISISSSVVSSPSIASSPSDHHVDIDDHDVSLIQSLVAANDSMMEPWYSSFDDTLQTFDQMFNVPPFDPPTMMIDDFYEEGDIRLWSFC